MIHHVFRTAAKHAAKYYIANPHQAAAHGAVAAQAGVHISKLAWTHGPTVAKHTASFLQKAALKGFSLFRS